MEYERLMLLRILSIFVVMLVLPTAAVAAPDPAPGGHKVRYIGQARTDYYVELLQLALSYPFSAHPATRQGRQRALRLRR